MNPGSNTVSPRSRSLAPGAAFRHSASEPTAAIVPAAGSIATALARGLVGSMDDDGRRDDQVADHRVPPPVNPACPPRNAHS